MRLSRIATALALFATVTLMGCGDNSPLDFADDTTAKVPNSVKIRFNPLTGDVSTPNNLLFSGSLDGTINLPSEAAITSISDYRDITQVLGALDGWQTSVPFKIPLAYGEAETDYDALVDVQLDPASFADGVLLFKVRASGFADDCGDVSENGGSFVAGQTCRIDQQLVYGEDYTVNVLDGELVVTPLKPFAPASSYMIVVSSLLHDETGRSVEAGLGYSALSQAATLDDSASVQSLKGLTNWNNALLAARGVEGSISYAAVFTTQSASPVLTSLQKVYGGMALSGQLPLSNLVDTGLTAQDVVNQQWGLKQTSFAVAKYYTSSLRVPYYLSDLDNPQPSGADVHQWAQAKTDSPVAILQLLQTNDDFANQNSASSFWAQAAAQGFDVARFGTLVGSGDTTGAAQMLAQADLLGLSYVENGESKPVDPYHHLTAYNPLPLARSMADLQLDIYLPNTELLTNLSMPAEGWPVVIFQHGITTFKETAALIAAAYAAQGYAVVAIDLPYHGSRAIDLDGDGQPELSANLDAQVFANLTSFLSIRENLRQSSADILALRAALQAMTAPAELDGHKVHFVGHSLGAVAGIPVAALADTVTLNGMELDYKLDSAAFSVPGGGLAGVFLYSASFGPEVEGGLKANPGYLALVAAGLGFVDNDNSTALEQLAAYQARYPEAAELVINANYPAFATVFSSLAQTVVDGADPLSFSQDGFAMPVLLHEVVGDGSTGSGDQTIPNSVAGLPLIGTDALIATMGLEGTEVTAAGSYALRFSQGGHSSLISTSASPATTREMQTQLVAYALSADAGNATVLVSDSSVIAAAD